MSNKIVSNYNIFSLNVVVTFFIISCHFLIGQSVVTDIVRDDKGNISSIEYYSSVSKKLQLLKLETFHPNGFVSTVELFSNGLKSGVLKEFYDNGNIKMDGQYSKGNKSGLWTEYFREGGTMRMFYANEKGKDGSINEWYENGEKKISGIYSHGQKHAVWTTWYPNGVKESLVTYNNGKQEGVFSFFYDNGNKKSEGTVSYRGEKEQRCWDINGNTQNCSKES